MSRECESLSKAEERQEGQIPVQPRKDVDTQVTQSQLQDLLESDSVRSIIEGAEERGFVEPAELEAMALEHELSDDDVDYVTGRIEDFLRTLGS